MANPDRIVVTAGEGAHWWWRRQRPNGENVCGGLEPFSGMYEACRAGVDLWPELDLPVYRAWPDGTYSLVRLAEDEEGPVAIIEVGPTPIEPTDGPLVSAPLVPPGTIVEAGTMIAPADDEGYSSGPHVRFVGPAGG